MMGSICSIPDSLTVGDSSEKLFGFVLDELLHCTCLGVRKAHHVEPSSPLEAHVASASRHGWSQQVTTSQVRLVPKPLTSGQFWLLTGHPTRNKIDRSNCRIHIHGDAPIRMTVLYGAPSLETFWKFKY